MKGKVILGLVALLIGVVLLNSFIGSESGTLKKEFSAPTIDESVTYTEVPQEPVEIASVAPTRKAASEQTNDQDAAVMEPQVGSNIGLRNEYGSVEFALFLGLSSAGQGGQIDQRTGRYRDEWMVKAIQQDLDLSDDELQKYLEYASEVAKADTEFQQKLHKDICSNSARFSSLHDFGRAINGYAASTRSNQEALAGAAAGRLGQSLYTKIESRVRSKPLPELTEGDFEIVYAARNEGLKTEFERFCGFDFGG